ncbi:hypothetical protein EYC80_000653 [Monilinia laxa]|nr:hypothetical protein EYC80_000653 [Monilinia laxa]
MHIWRCTLFLLFGGHFDAAITCIRAAAIIGYSREVNVACGRHIAFFLSTLIEKKRSSSMKGREAPGYLGQRIGRYEMDEEVLAYLSGDLQGGDEAWIWQGRDVMGMRSPGVSAGSSSTGGSPTLSREGDRDREMRGLSGVTGSGGNLLVLSEAEARDWGGWERVQYLVDVFARESSASGPVPTLGIGGAGTSASGGYNTEPRGVFGLGVGVGPGVGGGLGVSGGDVPGTKPQTSPLTVRRDDRSRGSERMSITNII